MRTLAIMLLPVALAGCDTPWAAEKDAPPITIKGDTFCELADKQSWSTRDTRETITNARRANAKIDRVCADKKPTS